MSAMEPAGRPVAIEVVDVLRDGTCPHGCVPGDRWLVRSGVVPEGFCGAAYHTLFPYLNALRFGGSFPWETVPGVVDICCPDPANPVVFRLTAEGPEID